MINLKKIFIFLAIAPKHAAIFIISLYQKTLSPDHGWFKDRCPYGYCRHYPSCSEYSKQAIGKFGLIKGGLMSAVRVIRCNPFSKPAVDFPALKNN